MYIDFSFPKMYETVLLIITENFNSSIVAIPSIIKIRQVEKNVAGGGACSKLLRSPKYHHYDFRSHIFAGMMPRVGRA